MQVDKFYLYQPCSQAIIYRPAFFHSNNSNWSHSTSMLHTSGLVTSPSVCNLYIYKETYNIQGKILLNRQNGIPILESGNVVLPFFHCSKLTLSPRNSIA